MLFRERKARVSGKLWDQATDSKSKTVTAGADNASGTHVQASLFGLFAEHEIGREPKAISQWLDEHRELIGLAAEELRRHGAQETGRRGLPAESVFAVRASQAASPAEL
jgi:hypothetical protein